MREAKAQARSCVNAGPSEFSPHTDVIRTIISCADQFIVLIFHCGPIFYFLIQYYNLKKFKFRNIVRAHISRLVSLLVILFEMPFSHNGLKTTTGIYMYNVSQVNKCTLSYQFLYGNVQGCVFAKNRPVSLN